MQKIRYINNNVIANFKRITLNESIDNPFYCWWPCRVFYNIFEHVDIGSVLLFQVSRPIAVNRHSKFLELDIWE